MSGGCQLCALTQGGGPVDGWVAESEEWATMGHPLQVPGWLCMVTRRHIESLADMNDTEANELGGLLRSHARALMESSGADRVYTYSLGHTVRHLHLLIGIPGDAADTEGPRLLTRILERDPSIVAPGSSARLLSAVATRLAAPPT